MQNKTVEMWSESYPEIPEKAADFMVFWQSKIDQIPKAYRDSARIEISVDESYGSSILYAMMTYVRPETKKEGALRRSKAKEQGKIRDDRDRKAYEQLKAKFEPSN